MKAGVIVALGALACLPRTATAQRRAAWSPNGRQLAFTFDSKDSAGIYLAGADGSGLHRLFASGGTESFPNWSRDGREIVFASDSGGHADIYAISVDGTKLRRLTTEAKNTYPSWSPDGKSIAFNSNRAGKWQVFVMRSDGSDVRQVTHRAFAVWNPEWAPDGKHIAIETPRGGHDPDDLFVVDVKTGVERALPPTTDGENWIYPSWSPDGKRIAFCVVANREVSLRVVNADGTGAATPLATNGCLPQWSRKDDRIAFSRPKGTEPGIYVMDLRTATARRVAP
jgi:TolB protein